jgi:hypothetical protein
MRAEIMAELKKQKRASHSSINAIGRGGVADLWGVLDLEAG